MRVKTTRTHQKKEKDVRRRKTQYSGILRKYVRNRVFIHRPFVLQWNKHVCVCLVYRVENMHNYVIVLSSGA